MSVVLILIAVAALALCGLAWWRLSWRADSPAAAPEKPAAVGSSPAPAQELPLDQAPPAQVDAAPATPKDVSFRSQGERGMAGPIWGDVMCADGVYLPHVWEQDLHSSYDGRWLRTGFYDSASAYLVDRKSRRSWVISQPEGELLDAIHWRMPRWSGETLNESGIADDAHVIMSDASFEAWLTEHLQAKPQSLVALQDIWLPPECVPAEARQQPPHLPVAPLVWRDDGKIQMPNVAAPELTLQRHWPASLRDLRSPLLTLQQASWALQMNGKPTGWLLDQDPAMAWRADGQALALYAYPEQGEEGRDRCLAVWTADKGWHAWQLQLPRDRKPWRVEPCWPDAVDARASLQWSGALLLQRVQVDTPETERLHEGTSIRCVSSRIQTCAAHAADGRVQLGSQPVTTFCWLRDPAQPDVWRAQSEPVLGQPLIWTLSKQARDEPGETSAWNLQWGDKQLSGSWALEHVIVKGRWALLMPFARAPEHGGAGQVQVWDGERLQSVDLPWPVMRLRPLPELAGRMAARAGLIALAGCLDDQDWSPTTSSWRWNVHAASSSHLSRPDWRALYMHREIAPDAQGRWRLLPRWREVQQIQHPCADGDYVWRDAVRGDALWWWGGQNESLSRSWGEDECRIEGVSMTRSGLVLCGTGPGACPHPAGEGWVVTEWVERRYGQPNRWRLHWLNPAEKELRTLELSVNLLQLQGWDTQGLHWRDLAPEEDETQAAAPQLVTLAMWSRAAVEALHQGGRGLWLRKQDLRYAQALLGQADCPWKS